jgi:hypothetical protein
LREGIIEIVHAFGVRRWGRICGDTAAEKDPQKAQDLLSLLQAVIKEDHEEVRVRMAFLAKKYASVISDAKAAD